MKTSTSALDACVRQVYDLYGGELESMTVERAVIGIFFTGVKLEGGAGGCCFTPVKDIPQAVCCPSSAAAMPISGKLRGRKVADYLNDITSDAPMKKALGIAVLNALASEWWDRHPDMYNIIYGMDSFDAIELNRNKQVVIIGALVPVLRKCIKEEIPFHVLEKDPATLIEKELPFYRPADEAGKYIPKADTVIITGTTVINGTIDGLLQMARPGAEVLLTGPTASMLPDTFFERGVTLMGGIRVTKPDEFLEILTEGGSGYHFFGKSAEMTVIKRGE